MEEDSAFEKAISKVDIYYIMNNIPVGIVFLKAPKGRITYANERAKQLYGVNPLGLEIKDQATKLMTLYRTNGEPYPTDDLPMSRAMRGINVTDEELIIQRHNDSSRIVVSATAIALTHDNGEIVGAVGVFEDITARKDLEKLVKNNTSNLEAIIKERTKKLEESQRMAIIGETAGMVGHDIRNPLQAIAGDLYLVDNDIASLQEGETKKSLQESIKSIQDNLQYIAKIVEDLQAYAKQPKPDFKQINVSKVIEDVLLIVDVPDNLQVFIDIEKGFPLIRADPLMLKRVLSNLVQNAVQAMPKGGKLTISAIKNEKEKKVFICVEDTGVGIPEEFKPKMFTPLITTKSQGQGLGLAVVKRLVEGQGGTITFESQVGKGTKFTVELLQTW